MFIRFVDWFFKRYYYFTAGCECRPVRVPAVVSPSSLLAVGIKAGRPSFDLSKESKLHRWFSAWEVLTGRMDALDWGDPIEPSVGAQAVMIPGVFEMPKVLRDEKGSYDWSNPQNLTKGAINARHYAAECSKTEPDGS